MAEKKPKVWHRAGKFFRDCKSEIKKIVWPTPRSVFKNMGVVLAVIVIIGLFVFGLETDTFVIGGVNIAWAFLLAGNVVFVIYDYALSNLVTVYFRVLHPRLSRVFRWNRTDRR